MTSLQGELTVDKEKFIQAEEEKYEQAQISTRLNDPELYKGDPAEGIRLNRRFAEIEEELMNCITRWDELESKTQD